MTAVGCRPLAPDPQLLVARQEVESYRLTDSSLDPGCAFRIWRPKPDSPSHIRKSTERLIQRGSWPPLRHMLRFRLKLLEPLCPLDRAAVRRNPFEIRVRLFSPLWHESCSVVSRW